MSASSAGSAGPATSGVTRKIIQRVIKGAVVLVALFLLLVTVLVHHFTYDACANIAGRQKKVPVGFHLEGDDGDRCVANPPPPPPTPRGVGKQKTLYEFPSSGCVTVPLRGNWSDYPKGGSITIIPVTGGTGVVDEPGTKHTWSLPDGNYQVCRKDPGAWGVEIWQ